jgi:SWI/SNF-related matrix-associated actin-dependent regulator 1 of chromatin subfamily A
MMPFVEKANGRFEFRGAYGDRLVPKAQRWRWDPDARCWWTDRLERAVPLLEYAKGAAEDEIAAFVADREHAEERAEASRATSADIDVPCPDGLAYLPFQLAGIRYALTTRTGNALIADEMGLGKTIQALGVVNVDETIRTVLVICPHTVKLHWRRECKKWLVRPSIVLVWGAGMRIVPVDGPEGTVVVHIANWDILSRRVDSFDALNADLVILDESQRMKNPNASRTRAALAIAEDAARVLCLTGTPVLNRPEELWTTVHLLDAAHWPQREDFEREYCRVFVDRWGHYKADGTSHLDGLSDKLRGTIMVRRRKEDVLAELPQKRRQVVELDPSNYQLTIAREARALGDARRNMADARERLHAIDAARNREQYADAMRELSGVRMSEIAEISRARHETALAKVQDVIRFVGDCLEAEPKVVVFAHHRDVHAQISAGLRTHGVVGILGGDKIEDREAAVGAFQHDPAVRVFVGSTTAAGIGITLTAARCVVFAELDWTPANMTQAEDRTHRIGQTGSVSVYHLVVDGSIDAMLASALVEKQAVIDAAVGDVPPDESPTVTLGLEG